MEASPFSESEKLQLFAEIISVTRPSSSSPSASDILLNHIVNESLHRPDWNNTVLPSGRTVSQCQQALADSRVLHGSRPGPPGRYNIDPRYQQQSFFAGGALPGLTDSQSAGRALAPRPPDVPQSPYERHGSSYTSTQFVDTNQRKRGRPSKAEAEKRRAAEARGESVPRPRAKKPRPSLTEPGAAEQPTPGTPASSGVQFPSPALPDVSKVEPSPVTATTSASSASFPQTLGQRPPPAVATASGAFTATSPSETPPTSASESRDRRSGPPTSIQLPGVSNLPTATSRPQEPPQRTVPSPYSFPPASRPPSQHLSISSFLSPPEPRPPSGPTTRAPER